MQQLFTSIAQQGYVLQALATTAGMLERGNAAAFIGADEDRATAWLSHADPHYS
jgi:uncharacterized protein YaaQ